MVALRSHHHQADRDDEPRNILNIDLPSDEDLRIQLADGSSSYAEWLMTAYPDTYQKWLKTRDLRRFGTSDAIVPITPESAHSESAGYGSMAIAPVVTFPVYTIWNFPQPQISAPDPEREFKAEIAWLAFGELIDAYVTDFMRATAFMTVYDVDLFWFEALNTEGLTVKQVGRNVTFCGALKLLTERREKLAACGVRASQMHREVPLSENLTCRYTWVGGVQQIIPRKIIAARL